MDDADLRSLVDLSHRFDTKVYTTKLCVEECIQEAGEKLSEALKRFDTALNRLGYPRSKAPTSELLINESKITENSKSVFERALKDKGLDVLADAAVPQEKLLEWAVKHVRPFEERDKGFKDTVIFCSILDHARRMGFKDVILISNDGVFDHPNVRRRAQSEGIRLTIATTIQDALPLLRGALNEMDRQRLEAETEHLRRYLLSQWDTIAKEVRKEAAVYPLTFDLFKIHQIKEFEFRNIITVVTTGFPEEVADGGRVRFGFGAEFRITVSGEPITLPQLPGPVKLEGAPAEEEPPPTLSPFSLSSASWVEAILRRTLVDRTKDVAFPVQASAVFHRAKREYSDLDIEKVNPAGTVVRRLLSKKPDWSDRSG